LIPFFLVLAVVSGDWGTALVGEVAALVGVVAGCAALRKVR
jgi:hypothetical protein